MAEAAGYPFRLLDVFAERKHQGNQLLVLADSAAELSDVRTPSESAAACAFALTCRPALPLQEVLLAITREINFAESGFICGTDPDGAVRVRIFTPEYEVRILRAAGLRGAGFGSQGFGTDPPCSLRYLSRATPRSAWRLPRRSLGWRPRTAASSCG